MPMTDKVTVMITYVVTMVDTDDTRSTTDVRRWTTDAGQRQGYGKISPQVS